MLRLRDDAFISLPRVSMESRLFAILPWDAVPELSCALARAVADVEGDDLSGFNVNRNPDPLLVLFALDEAPHFIGLRLQSQEADLAGDFPRQLDVEIIRQAVIQLPDEAQQPAQADLHHTADAQQ